MTTSDLDAELRRGASAAAEAMVREAREEADRIEADASRAIEGRRAEVFERWEDELRGEARAAVAGARREATREVLLAKSRLVERVLARAEAELDAALASEAYRASVAEEVHRALEFVESGSAVVRCDASTAALVETSLSSSDGIRVEIDDGMASGFIVSDQARGVVVDATLLSRLKRLSSALSVEILGRIEESPQ